MTARGPDGKGQWLSDDRRVGLAHRRLSIIDLSDAAGQPMQTDDGQLVISFNGEIYNYQALRDELVAKGYEFRTHSDTEVLLHLYRDKGEAMVHQLRGMFAFAIWDKQKQSMLLARDPYGIKPLYYADDGSTVRVASQVKALLAGGTVAPDKDPAGVVGFYLLGSVPEPFTTCAAIKALPAGCTLWLTDNGPQAVVEYFSIGKTWAAAEQQPAPHEDIQQTIRNAMLDSVKHHMVADVPVAVFLSAGVDSGTILGLMRELAPDREIQAVTLVFEEYAGSHNDEGPLASEVAESYGARHTRRIVTREEFEADLPNILAAMDQPSIDGINAWFVSKAAKELGIKVALSGLGGDELFGGYPAFEDVPRWQRRFSPFAGMPLLGNAATRIGALLLGSTQKAKAAGLIQYGGTWAGAWLLRRGIFMPWELAKLLPQAIIEQGMNRLRPLEAIGHMLDAEPRKPFAKVATLESTLYMRNQLLRDADWAGMAHSVEIRVPLVDVRLLRTLAPYLAVSPAVLGKTWLGNSPVPPLSTKLIERDKTGFTTPMRSWMKTASDKDLPNSARQHWSRTWATDVAGQFELIRAA